MSEPNGTQQKKQKLKDELDSLLRGFDDTFKSGGNATGDAIVDKQIKINTKKGGRPPVDMDVIDDQLRSKAKNVISSMFDFYLDFGVIEMPDYLERKKELDTANISSIFLQLSMLKTVLKRVMEDITTGNTTPRVLEAYSTINAQYTEAIKAQANYVLFLEESYKKMRYENDSNPKQIGEGPADKNGRSNIATDSDFYLTNSQKSLVEEVTEKSPVSIDDVKQHRNDSIKNMSGSTRLTDPKNKENLMEELNITIEKSDSDQGDGYTDILDTI